MSGIKAIKEKAKLSIDEMFENQTVGKMETRLNGNTSNQKEIHPAGQPDNQVNGNPINKNIDVKTENQLNGKMVKQENIPANFKPKPQQSSKPASYKMTFNLTEESYKAFNDLYAKRMLQGRKTEKSDLICEAIQWLIQMEE